MSDTKPTPDSASMKTHIRLSICAGAKPRVSIGVPKSVFEEAIGTPPGLRAIVKHDDATGNLRVEYGYNLNAQDSRGVTGGEGSGYYWTQFYPFDAPWVCTAAKRGAVKLYADVIGQAVVAHTPLPVEFYAKPIDAPRKARDATKPDVCQDAEEEPQPAADPREELAKSLAHLNAGLAAAEAAGRELRVKVADNRVSIRIVEEVEL